MSANAPIETYSLFIEGERGVLETTVGLFEQNGKTFVKPIATSLCSGDPPLISRSLIHGALATQEWFDSHPEVIAECRVWYPKVK
ncbi:hypothetical protein OAG75_01650 [bacterium]|nr:hypothetical protein [bacterium]MDB4802672.1 hypothetical protein [bacterium]